jgi:hypothetical protein
VTSFAQKIMSILGQNPTVWVSAEIWPKNSRISPTPAKNLLVLSEKLGQISAKFG